MRFDLHLRHTRSQGLRSLITIVLIAATVNAQTQTLTCSAPGGFGVAAPPAAIPPLDSLKSVANPVLPNGPAGLPSDDVKDFIANQPAAIQLGKALFWDMQAGSDNATACATCHFQAGADNRTRNQLHPGKNGAWDGYAANYALKASDFPFTAGNPVTKDIDNVAGSQGIHRSNFTGIDSKSHAELISTIDDSTFLSFRQVTPKHSPSVINAVFNHRNFWNGRAQPDFNGVDPFGTRNSTAKVWQLGANGTTPAQINIRILNASLASQALGPPLNGVEMSAAGRTFPDIGRKVLSAKPLALQKVDPGDSVLGPLADVAPNKGLKTTYTAMIQKAFQPKWWDYTKKMPFGTYTMMEANFSLYWGLAIMLYEATLVADNSPMDQYLLTRVFQKDPATQAIVFDPFTGLPILLRDNPALLDSAVARAAADASAVGLNVTRDDLLGGLALFERPAPAPPNPQPGAPGSTHPAGVGSFPLTQSNFGFECTACHTGAETTSASVRNLIGGGVEAGRAALRTGGYDIRMERMFGRADWWDTGPLTVMPLGIDPATRLLVGPSQLNFDPNRYSITVTGMPVNPGHSLPLPLPVVTYDVGWYDLGVRPLSEDAGLGDTDPFGKALSWTALFQSTGTAAKVPGDAVPCAGIGLGTPFPNELVNAAGVPILSGPLQSTEATDVAGTFKVPGLRNVELTGPYLHTGGLSTLAQVVGFYDQGGNFNRASNPSKSPAIVPLRMSVSQATQLIAFLLSLTDERVRFQRAPFDHPELVIPDGAISPGVDAVFTLPAVGAAGSATPLSRFLDANPFN